jgi:hypothetical protein
MNINEKLLTTLHNNQSINEQSKVIDNIRTQFNYQYIYRLLIG